MLKVERFINELMTSNCYLVYDEDSKSCIIIDPGSEKSLKEIKYIEEHQLQLDYIVITHEHTDHNWGVNALRENYIGSKLICSETCNKNVKNTNRSYFLFYYDDPDYRYEITPADVLICKEKDSLSWNDYEVKFFLTPGHSQGAMCVSIAEMLFTGDTIMPYKPYFNGRDSNKVYWKESVLRLLSSCKEGTIVYPGHGESLLLNTWKSLFYDRY